MEKEAERGEERGTRKEQMEEEGITVPSFPANSFQGSRTLSTEPNSKVIAPIPASTRNPCSPPSSTANLKVTVIFDRLFQIRVSYFQIFLIPHFPFEKTFIHRM